MPRYSEDFLNQLFEICDIEQVISPYTELRRRGRHLVGLCPFHNERTPSFVVYPETHSFYCFGCGAAGTVIQFLQRAENLDFQESVKTLCDRFNIPLPTEVSADSSLAGKKKRMFELNKEAARFFHSCLFSVEGKAGLDYYISRGYSKTTINHFGMGYAPDSWRSLLDHLKSKGYSYEEVYEANLAKRSEKNGKVNFYDNFRNRVMVPIIDVRGRVVAFGGRVLDDSKPKYINTSDTLVFKKGEGVFGLNFAKASSEKSLLLVEGYMDAISLHQAGFTNAIACLGTALTDEMARLISRYCDEVIISYDADEAGQRATERAIRIFSSIGLKMRVVHLTGGKDPDEILKKYGSERFRSILEGAANDIEFELLKAKEQYDISSEDGKLKYLTAACVILAGTNDSLAVDIYSSKLSDELGVDKDTIKRRVSSIKSAERRGSKAKKEAKELSDAVKSVRPSYTSNASTRSKKAQERIILILQKNPEFIRFTGDLKAEDFTDERLRLIFEKLSAEINEGGSVEENFLSVVLERELFEKLMRLIKRDEGIPSTKEELEECINVLKTKPDIEMKNAAKMSDEEFLEYFKKKQ